MADEAALDQALADLSSQVDELQAAAQAILDKVAAEAPQVDLSDEIATIQGFGDRVTTTTQAMKDAVTAPATEPPTEPPVEEPVTE